MTPRCHVKKRNSYCYYFHIYSDCEYWLLLSASLPSESVGGESPRVRQSVYMTVWLSESLVFYGVCLSDSLIIAYHWVSVGVHLIRFTMVSAFQTSLYLVGQTLLMRICLMNFCLSANLLFEHSFYPAVCSSGGMLVSIVLSAVCLSASLLVSQSACLASLLVRRSACQAVCLSVCQAFKHSACQPLFLYGGVLFRQSAVALYLSSVLLVGQCYCQVAWPARWTWRMPRLPVPSIFLKFQPCIFVCDKNI